MIDLEVGAGAPVRLRRWTRAEFERLADSGILRPNERVELIGGRIVEMSPQDPDHTTGIQLSDESLRRAFGSGFTIRTQVPLALSEDGEPEPDVAVVPGSPRDYAAEHPTTALLVVEVARTSLAFDRGEKASLYASAGVPEYWIVNLVDRRLEVHREPVPVPGAPFGHAYRTRTLLLPGESVQPLARPEASVAVADLLP